MQVIFSRAVADQLKEKYIVLELETFDVNGQQLETFCVVPPDLLQPDELLNLTNQIELHEKFVKYLKEKNYKLCVDIAEHLVGKFGGELDSFYQEITNRIQQENKTF